MWIRIDKEKDKSIKLRGVATNRAVGELGKAKPLLGVDKSKKK
jgi:hypothetical protein